MAGTIFAVLYLFPTKLISFSIRYVQRCCHIINIRFNNKDIHSRRIIVLLCILFAWKMYQFNFRMKCLRLSKFEPSYKMLVYFKTSSSSFWKESSLSQDMNCFREMYVSKVKPAMNKTLAMTEVQNAIQTDRAE